MWPSSAPYEAVDASEKVLPKCKGAAKRKAKAAGVVARKAKKATAGVAQMAKNAATAAAKDLAKTVATMANSAMERGVAAVTRWPASGCAGPSLT